MRGFPEQDIETLVRKFLCHYCGTDCGPTLSTKHPRICRWCAAEKAEKQEDDKPVPSYCRGEA